MKSLFRFFSFLISISFFLLTTFTGYADPPDPPPVPGSHGHGGNVGAPVDGGMGILLLLGIGYGTKIIIVPRKRENKR